MASPEDILKWMDRMEYVGKRPSEESLKNLCRASMGIIFQQIIEKVKPVKVVRDIKMNILIDRIENEDKIKYMNSHGHAVVEKIKLYQEKCRMQQQLHDLVQTNNQNDQNLQLLTTKIDNKYVRLQAIKQRKQQNERDLILYRGKRAKLNKQIETENALLSKCKSFKLDETYEDNKQLITEKVTEVLSKITAVVSRQELSVPSAPERGSDVANTTLMESMKMSTILCMSRRPLSTRKRKPKLNVTDTPSFARNRISMDSTSSSGLDRSIIEHPTVMSSLEKACADEQISVADLWKSTSRNDIFEVLVEMKRNEKEKLAALVATEKRSETINFDLELSSLYRYHIQNELIQRKLQFDVKDLMRLVNMKFEYDVDKLTVLEAIEAGLVTSVAYLRKNIDFLNGKIKINSSEIDHMLSQMKEQQNEMIAIKRKTDAYITALSDVTWLEKAQRTVSMNIPKYFSADLNWLSTNYGEVNANTFRNYLDDYSVEMNTNRWNRIYESPEAIEFIETPHLRPEAIFLSLLAQRNSACRLRTLRNDTNSYVDDRRFAQVFDGRCEDVDLSGILEKLDRAHNVCVPTYPKFDKFKELIDFWLESPLQRCISPKRLFDGHNLDFYIKAFEEHYSQLKPN